MRRWWIALLSLLVLVAPARAWAAKVTAGLTSDVVEVGEGFYVELRAEMTDGSGASDPQLRAPKFFSITGPSTSTGVALSMGTGRGTTTTRTLTARWFLIASQLGTYTIPSPSVRVGGQLMKASGKLRVKVVEVGKGPRKPKRPSGSFGGFGSFFGPNSLLSPPTFSWENEEPTEPDDLEPEGRRLMLDAPPDPDLFVVLKPDRDRVVVGEQVTLTAWLYHKHVRIRRPATQEPTFSDFVRMDLGDAHARNITTLVDGEAWTVQKMGHWALFPLRAGKLSTGALVFKGQTRSRRAFERRSNEPIITVREPPLEHRPAGYRIGDVGRFELSAEVRPRSTTAGDTVAVQVKVAGRGLLPSSLRVPVRAGVEWLDPEKKEQISTHNKRIGGWRSFGYAVRLQDAGEVDLGAIELSFWDPTRRKYETAAVQLGRVRVAPSKDGASAAEATPSEEEPDPFKSLAGARAEMGAFEARGDESFDPMWLWGLVLLPPAGVMVAQLGASAAVVARRRRRDRKDDPAVLAKKALSDAASADDAKDAAAAVERAVHLAVEAATGIKSRGVLQAELEDKLTNAELDEALATKVVDLLERCSALRFDPAPDEDAAATLGGDGKKVVKALLAERS